MTSFAPSTAAAPLGQAGHPIPALLGARLELLRGRGVDLRASAGAWAQRMSASAAVEPDPRAQWGGAPRIGQSIKGVLIEGLRPASLLVDVWRSTPTAADGFRTPIYVVHHDEAEAIEGLARAGEALDPLLADDRVHWFIGPGAAERLSAHLRERIDCSLPSEYVRSPMLGIESRPGIADVVRLLHQYQQSEHQRLLAAVRGVYEGRDARWWHARFEGAGQGGEPLRVLLPISRYSTFVRHAAADLAEALRARGVETRLLSEPDDQSRLVSVAYLRAFADWRPDAVILINFCRRHMGDSVPANIPFITWIQDRMAHLFDDSVGRSLGGLDFVAGHLHRELFDIFGWPRARRLPWFIPASERKFHAGPAGRSLLARHECEIAYVSHQSETPEAGHAQLRQAFAGQPVLLKVIDELFRDIADGIRAGAPCEGTNGFIIPLLKRAMGREPEDRLVNAIAGNYATPMAERIFRHVTLEWAARLSAERGWRLHLYGRGWERHPVFGPFARGPIEHDEDLRAAYQSARVHLHLSRNTNAHQRVYECVLSGGLMLRRGPSPDAAAARWEFIRRLTERQPSRRAPWGDAFYDLPEGGFPDPALVSGIPKRLIEGDGGRLWRIRLHDSWCRYARERIPPMRLEMMPDQAFPYAAETMFGTPEALAACVERAADAEWRSRVVTAQREWASANASCDRFACELLGFVAAGLAC